MYPFNCLVVAGSLMYLKNTAAAVVLFGIYDLLLPKSSTDLLLIFRIYFDFNVESVRKCFLVIAPSI